MGKHSKKVTTGDWNDEGLLVTGSEDKIITISNHNLPPFIFLKRTDTQQLPNAVISSDSEGSLKRINHWW